MTANKLADLINLNQRIDESKEAINQIKHSGFLCIKRVNSDSEKFTLHKSDPEFKEIVAIMENKLAELEKRFKEA